MTFSELFYAIDLNHYTSSHIHDRMFSSPHQGLIEPVVERSKVFKRVGKGNILADLPPLPMEEELFSLPMDKSNRKKAKSINVLVEALVAMMPEKGIQEIKLDETAITLDTSLRRVYTICHVMEVLQLMIKRGRKLYEWQGWKGMMPSLVLLKQMAENQEKKGQIIKSTAEAVFDKQMKLNIFMMTKKLLMMYHLPLSQNII